MTRLTLRLPDDLHRRVRGRCAEAGTSLNQFIVAAVREALARPRAEAGEAMTLQQRVKRLRAALGDMVVEIDPAGFPEWERFAGSLPGHEELARSLPRLDPPLSRTIAEEREEYDY